MKKIKTLILGFLILAISSCTLCKDIQGAISAALEELLGSFSDVALIGDITTAISEGSYTVARSVDSKTITKIEGEIGVYKGELTIILYEEEGHFKIDGDLDNIKINKDYREFIKADIISFKDFTYDNGDFSGEIVIDGKIIDIEERTEKFYDEFEKIEELED